MDSSKNFIVYNCSAGSGKTYNLVKEYLASALADAFDDEGRPVGFRPWYYRHILAITFTVKATAEMKERITIALKELSEGNLKRFVDLDLRLLEMIPNINAAELKRRATEVHHHLLHHYSEFSVSTIDKFVVRLVQSFAKDLDLSPDIKIELNSGRMVEEGVELLMEEVGKNPLITRLLVEYLSEQLQNSKSPNIENEVKEVAQLLFQERAKKALHLLKDFNADQFAAFKKFLQNKRTQIVQSIYTDAIAIQQLFERSGADPLDFIQGSKGIASMLHQIIVNKEVTKPYAHAMKYPSTGYTKKEVPNLEGIIALLEPFLLGYPAKSMEIQTADLMLRNANAMGLIWELDRQLTQWRTSNQSIPLADFNDLLSQEISGQSSPYIYERMGYWYHHLLIDEFQDTSKQQWENLLPLMAEGVSKGFRSIIVGDGKQSIYRWRGGEPELFRRLSAFNKYDAEEHEWGLKAAFKSENLTENRRSAPDIISFNNRFFAFLKSRLSIFPRVTEVYNSVNQNIVHANQGYLELRFLKKMEEKDPEGDDENIITDHKLEAIVQLVKELLNPTDGSAAAAPEQIAILVWTNKDGSNIASRLMAEKIPVKSDDSLWLGNHKLVQLIISILRVMHDESNEHARLQAASLKNYIVHENETLFQMAHFCKSNIPLNFWIESVIGHVSTWELWNQSPLYQLVEMIAAHFKWGETQDPFLFALLHFIRNRGLSHVGISEFLEIWDRDGFKTSIDPGNQNSAVVVTTVFKAKGLEYPIVILPELDFSLTSKLDKGNVWVKPSTVLLEDCPPDIFPKIWNVKTSSKLAETLHEADYLFEKESKIMDKLNEIYVALTRPKQQMYHFYSLAKDTDNNSLNLNEMMLQFVRQDTPWEEDENEQMLRFRTGIKALDSVTAESNHESELNIFLGQGETWKLQEKNNNSEESELGKWLHTAFSLMRSDNDHKTVGKKIMQKIPSALKEEFEKMWGTVGNKIAENDSWKLAFHAENEVYNEIELIDDSGQLKRLDRLILRNGCWKLFEFKTGSPQNKYQKQIEQYTQILIQSGIPVQQSEILYL